MTCLENLQHDHTCPESDLWTSDVFTQTVKSAGKDPSSELISFTFTQQMHTRVHASKTSRNITEDHTNNEAFGCNASDEL